MNYRKAPFWIILILFACASLVFVYHNGDKVFMIDLDVSMNAKNAKQEAQELARSLGLQLEGYQSAAAFLDDSDFQYYVELKAGGAKEFHRIALAGDYQPFYWYVRLFKPGEAKEFAASYSPSGEFRSFEIKVPEAEEGSALERQEAQSIAENEAQAKWNVDLSLFDLVESKSDQKPNGRVDHYFTYERKDIKTGDARYRLNLVVSGDQLSAVEPSVKVPDAFFKEFEEMRSYNETLASVAAGAMQLVYGLGMVIWFIILVRKNKLIFRAPLKWGIAIAVFISLGALNFISFQWLSYDTSNSVSSFITMNIAMIVLQALFMGMLSWITIVIAEALTREAALNQVQFWRLADKDVASSKNVLSQVLVGYLLVPLMLADTVAFYWIMGSRFGWWAPSSILTNPNILSTFSPFISAIGNALQPGFWEEAMFRAIPLATCVIWGRKYNKRWLFLILGMIVQTFVFSAGHANYPQQPFYFRLVELTTSSLVFGVIYLYFGLLSAVILHFSYDAVLMNLSALTSSAPGMALDRLLFFLFLLIPLWIVLIQKYRNAKDRKNLLKVFFSGWGEIPDSKLNKNFLVAEVVPDASPVLEQESEPEAETDDQESRVKAAVDEIENTVDNKYRSIIPLVTILLIYVVALTMQPSLSRRRVKKIEKETNITMLGAPKFKISVQQAKAQADMELRRILADADIEYPAQHKAYADYFRSNRDEIYQVLKDPYEQSAYTQIKDKYLFTDAWKISYKRLHGTLDEKGEQFHIYLDNKGGFLNYAHILPEARAGAQLDESEAREIALNALQAQDAEAFGRMHEISVSPEQLPNRRDWVFVYEDSLKYGTPQVNGRLELKISGDEVCGIRGYVFIPEQQQRELDKQKQIAGVFDIFVYILKLGFIIFAAIYVIIMLSRKEIDMRISLIVFILLVLLQIGSFSSTFSDLTEAQIFNPIEPYKNQLITLIISNLMSLILFNGFLAIMAGWASKRLKSKENGKEPLKGYLYLFALLTIISGSINSAAWLYLKTPPWGLAFAEFNFFAELHRLTTDSVLYFGIAVLLYHIISKWTANKVNRMWIPVAISFLIGTVYAISNGLYYWNAMQINEVLQYAGRYTAFILLAYIAVHKSNHRVIPIYVYGVVATISIRNQMVAGNFHTGVAIIGMSLAFILPLAVLLWLEVRKEY